MDLLEDIVGETLIKKCTKCKKNKVISEYPFRNSSYDGYGTICRTCLRKLNRITYQKYKKRITLANKKHKLKKQYGLTIEEYHAMISSQAQKCKICDGLKSLVIDHDHETKKIRGLLCQDCNKGLGFFKDSKTFLQSAIKYLEESDRRK